MQSFLPILVVVHQGTSTPGLVGQVLQPMGFSLDIRCPALGDALPANMAQHSAAIVFGGPMSANDDQFDFIRTELQWIPKVLAAEKPYLGICLGAQLLARTLGARVAAHPEGIREIGYFPIQPTAAGRTVIPTPMMVYQWHQEGFELPQGSKLLATGKTFSNQAFCYGHRAYGLQFHPEMTTLMVNHWTTNGAEHLVYPGAQSRWHHISHHRLYRSAVEQWLRSFLKQWILPVVSAETVWEQCHHAQSEQLPWPFVQMAHQPILDRQRLQQ